MNRMNLLKDIFLPRKSAQLGFDADLYNQIYQSIHFFLEDMLESTALFLCFISNIFCLEISKKSSPGFTASALNDSACLS